MTGDSVECAEDSISSSSVSQIACSCLVCFRGGDVEGELWGMLKLCLELIACVFRIEIASCSERIRIVCKNRQS